MVTRKAIAAAFEIIVGDPTVKTVTVFCPNRPAVRTFKMCRVRVTRDGRSKDGYRVQLGRINYAERRYVEKHISRWLATPKVWIQYKPKKKAK
jgi:hypothetical protein